MAVQLPPNVELGIVDQTSVESMTPAAWQMLNAAAEAAAGIGVRLRITAGDGGGHKSHSHGTEFDLVGFNADGSRWTREQRVAVASGAAQGGGDRFGLYGSGNSLHIGISRPQSSDDPGRQAAVWGAGGLTMGSASRAFSDPAEVAFLSDFNSGRLGATAQPMAFAQESEPEAQAITAQVFSIIPSVTQRVQNGGTLQRNTPAPEAVRELQRFLNAGGYTDSAGDELTEDGVFGFRTEHALMAYQQDRGLESVDGILGRQTLGVMLRDMAGEVPGPAVATLAAVPPVAAPAVSLARLGEGVSGGQVLRLGSEGDEVRELQAFLNAQGFRDDQGNALTEDGDFGWRTRSALRAYQDARGIEVDGKAGPQTFDRMQADVAVPAPVAAEVATEINPSAAARQAGADAATSSQGAMRYPPWVTPPSAGTGRGWIRSGSGNDVARKPPPYLGVDRSVPFTGIANPGAAYISAMGAYPGRRRGGSGNDRIPARPDPAKVRQVTTSAEAAPWNGFGKAFEDPFFIGTPLGFGLRTALHTKPQALMQRPALPVSPAGAASHPPKGGMTAPAAGFYPNVTGDTPPVVDQLTAQRLIIARSAYVQAMTKNAGVGTEAVRSFAATIRNS